MLLAKAVPQPKPLDISNLAQIFLFKKKQMVLKRNFQKLRFESPLSSKKPKQPENSIFNLK